MLRCFCFSYSRVQALGCMYAIMSVVDVHYMQAFMDVAGGK